MCCTERHKRARWWWRGSRFCATTSRESQRGGASCTVRYSTVVWRRTYGRRFLHGGRPRERGSGACRRTDEGFWGRACESGVGAVEEATVLCAASRARGPVQRGASPPAPSSHPAHTVQHCGYCTCVCATACVPYCGYWTRLLQVCGVGRERLHTF